MKGTGGYSRSTSRATAVAYGSVVRISSSASVRESTATASVRAACSACAWRGSCSRKSAAVSVDAVVSEPAMMRSKRMNWMSSSESPSCCTSTESRSLLTRRPSALCRSSVRRWAMTSETSARSRGSSAWRDLPERRDLVGGRHNRLKVLSNHLGKFLRLVVLARRATEPKGDSQHDAQRRAAHLAVEIDAEPAATGCEPCAPVSPRCGGLLLHRLQEGGHRHGVLERRDAQPLLSLVTLTLLVHDALVELERAEERHAEPKRVGGSLVDANLLDRRSGLQKVKVSRGAERHPRDVREALPSQAQHVLPRGAVNCDPEERAEERRAGKPRRHRTRCQLAARQRACGESVLWGGPPEKLHDWYLVLDGPVT
eukprot:5014164-Prymnesium_polylepis.1